LRQIASATAQAFDCSAEVTFSRNYPPTINHEKETAFAVDVMKELPATLVLRPFNYDTLAVVAHQFASDERLAEAALPALAIVVSGLIPVLLLSKSLSKSG
jgi:metal-dependent amidase/aminoacylase/carboxypeptidase family protein